MGLFDHMTVQEFSNEKPGNIVAWRIVFNEYACDHDKPPFFVYRRFVRGDGRTTSEYLQKSGEIDGTCHDGHFASMAEIGQALIAHDRIHAIPAADDCQWCGEKEWDCKCPEGRCYHCGSDDHHADACPLRAGRNR